MPKLEYTVHLYREFRQVRSGIPASSIEEALQWALNNPAQMGEPLDCEGRIISALVDVKDETETLIHERDTEYYALMTTKDAKRLAALESMLASLVAYDEDKIDAAEKSPDGDDYNELWNIFHALARPNQRQHEVEST